MFAASILFSFSGEKFADIFLHHLWQDVVLCVRICPHLNLITGAMHSRPFHIIVRPMYINGRRVGWCAWNLSVVWWRSDASVYVQCISRGILVSFCTHLKCIFVHCTVERPERTHTRYTVCVCVRTAETANAGALAPALRYTCKRQTSTTDTDQRALNDRTKLNVRFECEKSME